MSIPRLPLVLVEWHDAWTATDPVSAETAAAVHKPWKIHTLGWVLVDNAEGIQLVNEYYDGEYRGQSFIPRGMVVSVTPYQLTRPRRPKPKVEPQP